MEVSSSSIEIERIKNLRSYEILDTKSDPSFDSITNMAALLCDCPIALISLVDENRQWFKSKIGTDTSETPREISFCSTAIKTPDQPLVIEDAKKDARFKENPLVCAAPNIRFYAGFPIVTKEGFCLGTLCVIDQKPKKLSAETEKLLQMMAGHVGDLIALHKVKNDLLTFSKLSEQSTNMVAILDSNFQFEYVNPQFIKRSGYTAAEIIGKNANDILIGPKTDSKELTEILEATKKREKIQREICLHEKSGKTFWVKLAISPVLDDNGNLRKYIGIFVDITEFKTKQEQLILAKEEALEASKTKEQFLSNMSHEIRTPMNGIIGLSSILLRDGELSPRNRELITHINYSAESLLTILNDILDFSKMNAEKMTFEKINFDLSEIFSHLEGNIGLMAKEKGISFKTKMDNKLPIYVSGDPTRLNQILRNIVGNAVKFTEIGGIDIEVNLLKYTNKGPVVEVSVSDTGIGIAKHQLNTIFNEFEQASDYTTRKYGGTGLGMSIAKKLVEKFEGELSIQSQLGVGTVCKFTVQLNHPIIESLAAKTVPNQENNELPTEQYRILVADDNIMNQIVASDSLEKLGYQFDVADNGQQCVELYKKGHYDLILMDVQMPIMNGLEAAKIIRSMDSQIPILAMTASVMDHDKVKCVEAGMNRTIPKPIKPANLQAIITDFLTKKKIVA
uniref:response regulator n=1 Tax=Fulvivirga sp. TaxID=1931237 RepID=UPI00404AE1F0